MGSSPSGNPLAASYTIDHISPAVTASMRKKMLFASCSCRWHQNRGCIWCSFPTVDDGGAVHQVRTTENDQFVLGTTKNDQVIRLALQNLVT